MQNTANSRAFIEEQQFNSTILRNLHDGLLPQQFSRDVTDFGSGSVLNIKTIGVVTIQDGAEDVPFDYTPIESGVITMTINNYIGDAWYVNDELREDGSQIEALMAARAMESTRAIQDTFETRFLSYANLAQVDGDPNMVNGFRHRIASTEVDNVFDPKYLADLAISFDKANVPTAGRVLIVDPVCVATMNKKVQFVNDMTSFAEGLLKTGWGRDHKFVCNIFGFDIFTSNKLAKGAFSDGVTTVENGVANIAMCISDDNTKSIMTAWRRMPRVESERNKDLRRDEFVTSCRWGLGVQRVDTLGVLITDAQKY